MKKNIISKERQLAETLVKEHKRIKRIKIEITDTLVSIAKGNSEEIGINFYGGLTEKDNVDFNINAQMGVLKIKVFPIVRHHSSDIGLELSLSPKMYEEIKIEAFSGKVEVEDIQCKKLSIKTKQAEVEVNTSFEHCNLVSENADAFFIINAQSNVTLTGSTITGDVYVSLGNINELDAHLHTKTGTVKNSFVGNSSKIHDAKIKIASVNGNINIENV